MRRVIGMDIHRTFAEVVFWEDGRLRHHGRIDMTRSGLEGFGRSIEPADEIVIEATGNAMSVVRVLSPFARVIVANPMQVKAIAHARIKTDKIDAGVLAQLQASGFLPEERAEFGRWLAAGWQDTFRARYPAAEGQYTWWAQWGNARANNVGWRIDYVLASPAAAKRVRNAFIWPEVTGSDHCPVGVDLD